MTDPRTPRPTLRRLASGLALGLALSIPATRSLAQNGTAIEYFHAEFGHYFVTAFPDEAAAIDAGVVKGWQRTREQFAVFPAGGASGNAVCRFFSATFAPKSSHFYTPIASECDEVKADPVWQFEGIAFNLSLPDAAGACPAGTTLLYRLYNDGQSGAPNHRYTTRWDLFLAMRGLGWVPEGNGNTFAFACVPPTLVAPITTAEGMWAGPTNVNGVIFVGPILENREAWMLLLSPSTGVVPGFIRGTVNSASGALAGPGRGYFFGQTVAVPGTVTGSYSPRVRISVDVDGVTLAGTYVSTYDQVGNSQVIAGRWQISGGNVFGASFDQSLTVEVGATGQFTGSSPSGCQVSGTILPRASGKNVYDFSIATSGAACPLGASTSTGIAFVVVNPPQDGMALMGMTESTNPTNGFVWLGSKI
jgi:hypothetical protein